MNDISSAAIIELALDLASSLYKIERVETNVPRNLETLRLK